MRVVYCRLKEKMAECGVTTKELAAVAGVSTFFLRLKLRGVIPWQLDEVLRICVFFRIADVNELFSS